jgi:PAS domain S-box-containing protein
LRQDDPALRPIAEPDHEMLLAVYTHAVDAIFVADADTGLLLHINPAAGRLVGRDPGALVGLHQTALHPPAEFAHYAALFNHQVSAAAHRPAIVEALVRHADGRDIPVSITMSLYQRNGRRVLQGFFRDLNGQQTTMRALDHERARLAALIRAIPDLVWMKDPAGRYLACNPAFERLAGLPEAKVIGRTDYELFDATAAEFFRDHDRRAIEAGHPTRNEEWLTFRADDRRGLFDVIKTPMRDGRGSLLGVLGVARDITELRRAQGLAQGLAQDTGDDEGSETRRLRDVVSRLEAERDQFLAGPVVAFRWSNKAGWPVEYVSANVEDMFGYEPGELVSGAISYGSLIHPDDLACVVQEVEQAGDGPAPYFEHLPYRLRHRDGRYLWLHDHTRILRDPQGTPTHYFGYVLDVSERIDTKERLGFRSEDGEA